MNGIPSWIDRSAYPFQSHVLPVDGGQMHYLDEGSGRPLVLVHGTPTWSFLYRRLVRDLSADHRLVVPDHIGFGLSGRPAGWSYRPQDHARNLETLIDHLALKNITLVVHDFGGPIGLSYALDHPENVRALVIFNTFLWPLTGDPNIERANRLTNNRLGRWLYLRHNFSARFVLRSAWGKHRKLTPEVHRHYLRPFPDPASRLGTWAFVQALLGESDWYAGLWDRRDRIAGKPALLLWGLRDIAFRQKELDCFKGLFPHARVVAYPEVGHFVPDEAGPEVVEDIRPFLAAT